MGAAAHLSGVAALLDGQIFYGQTQEHQLYDTYLDPKDLYLDALFASSKRASKVLARGRDCLEVSLAWGVLWSLCFPPKLVWRGSPAMASLP